jgi:eukaryotic-like serine/threonine-protein kinase
MGEVHRATQLAMNRAVALKVLRDASLESQQAHRRFTREAEALSKMSHPNVVHVFDFGVDEESGLPFLVFELVEGRTLLAIIREDGPQPEARTALILEQTARALAHAHHHGIVHRDLKPANIMLAKNLGDGTELVKVLDFGIAKVLGSNDTGGVALTAKGQLLGTPSFASPEQSLGDKVDERSDLYSLGCLLHALLTGMPPNREAPQLPELLRDGCQPSRELRALHRTLLAQVPKDRPSRAQDVADQLAKIAAEARVGDTVEGPTDVRTDPGEAGTVLKDTILSATVVEPPRKRSIWWMIALVAIGTIAGLMIPSRKPPPEPTPPPPPPVVNAEVKPVAIPAQPEPEPEPEPRPEPEKLKPKPKPKAEPKPEGYPVW